MVVVAYFESLNVWQMRTHHSTKAFVLEPFYKVMEGYFCKVSQ